MRHRGTTRAAIACLTALATFGFTLAADDEQGFKRLGNGKDMTAFELVATPASTWKVDGNVIQCSGKPNGYFATKRPYTNYVLRFDYRYIRPEGLEDDSKFDGNSGYLIHIAGDHKVWPKCIEVQGMNRDVGKIFAIGGAAKVQARDNPEARQAARKPVGEWNSIEITSKDGALTASVNGTKVCESDPGDLKDGPIGFQSEGREIHFRNLRIKEL